MSRRRLILPAGIAVGLIFYAGCQSPRQSRLNYACL